VKFDHVLVLMGPQRIGKSTVCAILGGPFYGDFPVDPHSKDTIQSMQGKWVLELAEMEVTKRAETDALKAFISRSTDKARLAYGRLAAEFPRQCIFIATKNPGPDGTFLKDDTGNSRWWPVEIHPSGGLVDFKGLQAARDQLFAEAVIMTTEKGEKLYMDIPALKKAADAAAGDRHADDPWTERIAAWISELDKTATGAGKPKCDFLTSRQVFVDAMGGIDKQFDRKSQLSIAKVLRSLGWTPLVKRFVDRTDPVRGYTRLPHVVVPRTGGDDVLAGLL
jgi:predicted P-loop ATPase